MPLWRRKNGLIHRGRASALDVPDEACCKSNGRDDGTNDKNRIDSTLIASRLSCICLSWFRTWRRRTTADRKIPEKVIVCPLGWNRTSETLRRIVEEIAGTVNADQNINSQIFKIDQLVKQSSRNGRKLIAGEIPETVNTHQKHNLTVVEEWSACQTIQQEGKKADFWRDH